MKTKDDISKNRWENKTDLKEVIEFIEEFATKDNHNWSWVKNWDCKYISLRFDMRSGHFIIQNKDHKRITFEELKSQRK